MATTATTDDADQLERSTETVTKTLICPLETSHAKNERVRDVIDEWQSMAGWLAARMPSVDAVHWRTQSSPLRHMLDNEFPDQTLLNHVRDQAAYKVGEAYGSWDSNGRPSDEHPRGRFGDADYARFSHDAIHVRSNDRGFGLRVGLHPYDREWFHIAAGGYQQPYLESITEDAGAYDTGSCELHLRDDGSLTAHLAVRRDVEVLVADTVDTWVGVCLGEYTLFSAVTVGGDGSVLGTLIDGGDRTPRGREFRHHRDRFKRKRANLMERGDLRGLRALRDEHRRYTDYVCHNAAREIVDFATDHAPSGIRLEDMTGARETAHDDWIHDFPFAEIQANVAYKADEAGIPVEMVSPAGTKRTCRVCGHVDADSRDGREFECTECGYEVHAFVNGAANLARGS